MPVRGMAVEKRRRIHICEDTRSGLLVMSGRPRQSGPRRSHAHMIPLAYAGQTLIVALLRSGADTTSPRSADRIPALVQIAVVHNLPPGGARRRLASQIGHFSTSIKEVCLSTATPITADAIVIECSRRAQRYPRILRPPLRYVDLAALQRAWHRVAEVIGTMGADVLYLNPCRYLQAPPILDGPLPRSLYFCDEPRRVDAAEPGRSSRNVLTRPIYGPAYARERRLDRATIARASLVATNTHDTPVEIQRVYGREAAVIPMGVPDEMLERPNPTATEPFLLSVGALVSNKCHDLVLHAAAATTEHRRVVIVSPRFERDEGERLRSLARMLHIDLSLRAGISDAELAELYASAFATLYLARREPLGLVSLEAQACGCPVIVADEGGLPETVADGQTGWLVMRDPQAVAAKLAMLDDLDIRSAMSTAARRRARSFTWRASAVEVERLLSELHRGSVSR